MTASVGTVVVDDEMFDRGVKLQALGLALSIVSAAAFAFLVKNLRLVPPFTDVTAIPQVRQRLFPDFLSLIVAIGAGIAGSLSLMTGVSAALVGVMIAVALIPPAAAVGIGIAWGKPVASLGSTVLVLVNMLSINLSALVVLRYSGYRPTNWFQLEEARGATIRRTAILVVAIVALSAFLGGVTLDSVQSATTEAQIQSAVDETLADVDAHRIDLEITRNDDPIFREPSRVVVTVGITGDRPPDFAERIDARIESLVGREVDTEVHYVVVERADAVAARE
jgi:uncharacterized hydrophobic protein (TIGR00271 family)